MFTTRAISAAAAGAVGALSYKKNVSWNHQPVACASGPQPNRPVQRVSSVVLNSMQDSKLFQSYQTLHGFEQKAIGLKDVEEIMLGVGILDKYIAQSVYEMLKKNEDGDITFKSFTKFCENIAMGSDEEKMKIVFKLLDLDKNGMLDKFEIATVMKHFMFCRTNWFGEDILYEKPEDEDLYFEISTEMITQLKANKMAHDLVTSCHGGGRQGGVTFNQFRGWLLKGGKDVERFKALFDVLDVWYMPDLN